VILVFGHGQLGQELARAAHERGTPLRALARADADIAERDAVAAAIKREGPKLVVNAAAYTKVDQAEIEIGAAERGNAIGPGVLARACAEAGVPLLHISTDYVFDGTKNGAYVESDPIAPLGVYGRTKAAGEAAVRDALAEHVILRTSWLYGEFGHNFLKTVLRLAREREELRVVSDQFGCPTSTRELASGVFAIASSLSRGDIWGTYHFAGSGVTTWHGFAARIVAAQAPITGRKPRVTAIASAAYPTSARRPANSELDSGLFARTFGVRARPWGEEADAIACVAARAQMKAAPHVA
jgi:dTDP-4-dehydrorhamnose reductase